MDPVKKMRLQTETEAILATYIEVGDLKGAYDYILKTRLYDPSNSDLIDSSIRLDKKYRRINQHDDPIQHMKQFLNMEGDQLWWCIEAGNVVMIKAWMDKYDNAVLQHPMTGKTIVHESPKLLDNLELANIKQFSSVRDFDGVYGEAHLL